MPRRLPLRVIDWFGSEEGHSAAAAAIAKPPPPPHRRRPRSLRNPNPKNSWRRRRNKNMRSQETD